MAQPQKGKAARTTKAAKQTAAKAGNTGGDVVPQATSEKKKLDKAVVNEAEKKKLAFITRTIWTFVMIGGFFLVLAGGHLPLIIFVLVLQILTFKEIIALSLEPARDKEIPLTKLLNWYFLVTTVYFLDAPNVLGFFQEDLFAHRVTLFLMANHKFTLYTAYVAGFVAFVLTLKKGHYKFQFAQLCITHMTLLIVVYQAHLIIENILNGIIWFFLPCALVITNDIFAYLCGITFGRTQLIELSPKKTVEGFVGAWICTMIWSLLFVYGCLATDYFICPAENLSTNITNFPHCEHNPVFITQLWQVPDFFQSVVHTLNIKPIYAHGLWLATFASLIAPFGGFFALGLKRAFAIKDFGDTIPGHGGVTDRMDCQFLMGSFLYLYYLTFISVQKMTFAKILQTAIVNLLVAQIIHLIRLLLRYLHNIDAVPELTVVKVLELLELATL